MGEYSYSTLRTDATSLDTEMKEKPDMQNAVPEDTHAGTTLIKRKPPNYAYTHAYTYTYAYT